MLLYYGTYVLPPAEGVVSPNGDGVAESQRLAYRLVRPSTVDARLIGPGRTIAWQDAGAKDPGEYPLEPDVGALAEGKWRFVVTAVDADGQRSRAARTFTVNETLGFLELSRQRIRVTKRHGGYLGVAYDLARRARVLVTVEDQFGNVVRTLAPAERRQPGHVELAWNGRNDRGKVVASGEYRISVAATNRVGTVELEDDFTVRRVGRR
jgi:hypothetical protein